MASSSHPSSAVSPDEVQPQAPIQEMAALELASDNDPPTAGEVTAEVPSHRSHDPDHNQKRSDPFLFGSRYLEAGDNVFEYNAWDHVETDDAYKEHAERQFQLQREAPVSDFDKSEYQQPPPLHLTSTP